MGGSQKGREGGLFSSLSSMVTDSSAIFCRFCVEEFLARGISRGSLTFVHPDNSETLFGEPESDAKHAGRPTSRLFLHNPRSFYARVAATADIGFAEAFMVRDFTVEKLDDLTNIFRVLILNRDDHKLSASSLLLSRLGSKINALLHSLNRNTLSGSQRNIEAHYDLSNELFSTFLGDTWTYSCAYFDPTASPGSVTLEDAQRAKIDKIIDKARITEDCHVLDIGCGWGELAIRAVLRTGCRVTGITLSREQLALANKRAKAASISDRVKFEHVDYRVLASRDVCYDRIVSVEMIEAVGHEFLGTYFAAVQKLLAPNGLAVMQVITTPEERYEEYCTTTDFIQKHIFPGGICPSFEALVTAMARNSTLCVEHVENIGPHYATTLKEWRRRFLESEKKGDVVAAGFNDIFVRKWMYYFCYCEAGFATRTLGTLQIVFSGSNNTTALGGAPALAE